MQSWSSSKSYTNEQMAEPALPPLEPPPIRRTAILRAIAEEKDPPVDSIQDISDYCSL
jgi:hypothetical protein